jgi:hypothetical protein
MKKIINWLNSIDSRLDDEFEVKYLLVLGLGLGILFWGLLAVVLAALGS